jgi:hypothetical protein
MGVVTLHTKLGRMGSLDEAASASTHEVTRLLQAWGLGDDAALERLMPLVYNELHRLAHRYMAVEQPGQTLQTTALVHCKWSYWPRMMTSQSIPNRIVQIS